MLQRSRAGAHGNEYQSECTSAICRLCPGVDFGLFFFIIAAQTSWTMVLYSKPKRLADILRWDGSRDGATLIEDPRIALIFFVPGVNETYRVNGRAQISQDADIKRRFAVNGKEPTTVMVVTVEETFQHCAKALMRSDLWKAGSRGRPQGVPTIGDFAAARNPGTDSAAFNATYNEKMLRELY